MFNPVVWGPMRSAEDPMRLLLRFVPRRGAVRLWRCIVVLGAGAGGPPYGACCSFERSDRTAELRLLKCLFQECERGYVVPCGFSF